MALSYIRLLIFPAAYQNKADCIVLHGIWVCHVTHWHCETEEDTIQKNILLLYFPYNNGAHDMQPKTWPPLNQACQTPMSQWAGMSGINIQGAALCLVRVTPIKSLKKKRIALQYSKQNCAGGWDGSSCHIAQECSFLGADRSALPIDGFVVSIFFSFFFSSLFPFISLAKLWALIM